MAFGIPRRLGVLAGFAVLWVCAVPAARAETIAVTTASDVAADDGKCALREAVSTATTGTGSGAAPGECAGGLQADGVARAGANVVELAAARYELVPGAPLSLPGELTIQGVDAQASVIDGNDQANCAGASGSAVVVPTGAQVTLSGVAVTGGQTACGEDVAGGGDAGDGGPGGGILNRGSLTLVSSAVFGNATGDGGNNFADPGDGGNGGLGGGIYTEGPLTVSRSAIFDNATGDGGCTVTRQTNDSSSGGNGGGIYAAAGADLNILDSTVARNSTGDGGPVADNGGPCRDPDNGPAPGGSGGGIFAAGPFEMTHSTLAENQVGSGLQGPAFGSAVFGPGTMYNGLVARPQAGTSACDGGVADGGHNLRSPEGETGGCPGPAADPLLGPLQDNGGGTPTMAVGRGSPAIDAVPAQGARCTPTDQRGVARPQGPGCDIGAFERELEFTVAVDRSSFVFGTRADHRKSEHKTATLTNTGTGNVTVTGTAVTGADAASFPTSADLCTGHILTPGQSCTVRFRFRPLGPGPKTASLEFTDNAVGSPQSMALSGTGTPGPWLARSLQGLSFGHWHPGVTAPAQTVTLTNVGSAALGITRIVRGGENRLDFVGLTQTCTAMVALAPGDSCTAQIAFRPTAPGTRSANLTISDNAPRSPHHVSLRGTGLG